MRNPVKLPSVGHPLKNMRAKIFERDAGAGHKILDRARDDNIVGTSETCDPRGDVYCDAPNLKASVRHFRRGFLRRQLSTSVGQPSAASVSGVHLWSLQS